MQQEEKRLILEFMELIIKNMNQYYVKDMERLLKIVKEFEKTGK